MTQDCSTAIVIYEDRPQYEVGIKLLVVSLSRYAFDLDVHVFAPNATDGLQAWLRDRHLSLNVSLHRWSPSNTVGFNVKPDALLWALDHGYGQAVWLDDDIILTRPLPHELLHQPPEVMVTAEISRRFQTIDCVIPWGFALSRVFPVNPSACCFRVTARHRGFLEHWKTLLNTAEYGYWQTQPRDYRPVHMIGSDAVLHALLGSDTYSSLPIYMLRMGRDIAQCVTPSRYTPLQRLMSLLWGVPPLIHAMGRKPWLADAATRTYQALSPYACSARRFQSALGSTPWLQIPRRWVAWYRLTHGHPALTSLPFAFTRPRLRHLLRTVLSYRGSPLPQRRSYKQMAVGTVASADVDRPLETAAPKPESPHHVEDPHP